MKENILIFDTETTGLPPKGANYKTDYNSFPHIVQIAWWFNEQYYDFIIKPDGYVIPDKVAEIHGITTEIAKREGHPFQDVIICFLRSCEMAEKIISHNIYFDVSIVKANILRNGCNMSVYNEFVEPALHKTKRIDTMMKTIKFVNAKYPDGRGGKWPSLSELYYKLFEDTFDAHNALNDVAALVRCVWELSEQKVIELD